MSALLAYLHSLSMMALAAMLFVQLLSIDGLHDRQQLERFVRYSFGLAAVAGVMLISGVGLLVWAERGVAFDLRNPVFYIKLAVFAAMLLIAITLSSLNRFVLLQADRAAPRSRAEDSIMKATRSIEPLQSDRPHGRDLARGAQSGIIRLVGCVPSRA